MALKPVRLIYQSRINALGQPTTGLTNVKAQVYVDGAAKAVGANAILLTEVDATNAPGLYEGVISAAMLTSFGVAAGQHLEANINSSSANAPAIFRQVLTAFSTDDLDSHLGLQDTAIAAVKSDTAAIKVDLETGPNALNILNAKLDKIANNAGFSIPVPAEMLRPASGSNTYRIPVTFYNDTSDAVQDPDGSTVQVKLMNQAGADRSQYLVGYTAGTPGSAPMVRDSVGQYHVDVVIPSTAAQEELIFTFTYTVNGNLTARTSVTNIVTDIQAQGFALQSTLVDVQTRVTDVQSKVNDATFGLAAANTLQQAIKTQTDKIGDSNIGLAAIKAQGVANAGYLTDIQGIGFMSAADSLHAISQFLQNNITSGGKAV